MILEICEQLESDHCWHIQRVRFPSPHILVIRFELGIAECPFQPHRTDRSASDLKVDLHIDVGGSGVLKGAGSTQEFRNQATEDDKLRTFPVMMYDSY
jgi:hypothetical protein